MPSPGSRGNHVDRVLSDYINIPDDEAARRFAAEHLELFDLNVVSALVAASVEDARHAARYLARARILSGERWPEGPECAARLLEVYASLEREPGKLTLLTEAVAVTRPFVGTDLRGRAHPELLPDLLWVASLLLIDLFSATSERVRLDEAVAVQRAAVDVTRPGSEARTVQIGNLANLLAESSRATGDRRMRDEALALQRQVVDAPTTAADQARHQSNLAARLLDDYESTGQPELLEEAIELQRAATSAATLADPRNPDLPAQLHNLSVLLSRGYEVFGQRELLEDAVTFQRQAVQRTPGDDQALAGRLNNLAGHLADLYEATGNRATIEEAVALQRRALATTPTMSRSYPLHLNTLASLLADLYDATADPRLLEEAIARQQAAVLATDPNEPDSAGQINNLALHLTKRYLATGDEAHLHEALVRLRASVRATPEEHVEYHRRLNNLAITLYQLYEATQGVELIEEAISHQRLVVRRVPPDSPERTGYVCNLAALLSEAHRTIGSSNLLAEAGRLVRSAQASTPTDEVTLARTRATLARSLGDHARAVRELTMARWVFEERLAELTTEPAHRRDLAQRGDGLLGDLMASQVLAGDAEGAVATAERPRLWLAVPPDGPGPSGSAPVATAWVAPGNWETVVITTVDQRTYTSTTIDVGRQQIRSAVIATLNAARQGDDSRCAEAADVLCGLAGRLLADRPDAERLLIVPIGVAALLPFSAAPDRRGGRLVDHTITSLAPTRAWARAGHRPRPNGINLGIFHSGRADSSLDLTVDRTTFLTDVGGHLMERPTAGSVLARISADTPIAHFSCHGFYNQVVPIDSALRLESDLTIRAITEHIGAPWLVNLSACETAVPDLRASEELISFPTAFLVGGTAHVIASLWPVIDDDATAVNHRFYREIARGQHPADALHSAILQLRDEHPYRWGLFTHHGTPW